MSLDNTDKMPIFQIILDLVQVFCFSSTSYFQEYDRKLELDWEGSIPNRTKSHKRHVPLSSPMIMRSYNPCHNGISKTNSLACNHKACYMWLWQLSLSVICKMGPTTLSRTTLCSVLDYKIFGIRHYLALWVGSRLLLDHQSAPKSWYGDINYECSVLS